MPDRVFDVRPIIVYARIATKPNLGRNEPNLTGAEKAALTTATKRLRVHDRVFEARRLFLDRDGVINIDHGYVHRPEQFEFVPGIFELARFWTNELKRPIVVVTNQSGIGRGYFDERAYADLTCWMCDRFAAERTEIAGVYHCPYHPLHGVGGYRCDHPWRKPNAGMILQAASDLGLDLAGSAILGDHISDIEAGASAGIGVRILVGARPTADRGDTPSHDAVADLGEGACAVAIALCAGPAQPAPGSA